MELQNKYWIAVFPYLKTTDSLKYKDLEIHSSQNISELDTDISSYVDDLSSMFFLRDDVRIKNLSIVTCTTKNEITNPIDFIDKLNEFQSLISYIYSIPHHTSGEPFLNFEHSTYYLFRPIKLNPELLYSGHNVEILSKDKKLNTNEATDIPGYEGRINGKSYFWIVKNERIFPTSARIWLNISQDISNDFFRASNLFYSIVSFFSSRSENDELAQRILTAITWYNRTNQMDIEEEIALINLSIAFESLLNLDRAGNIKSRFKETVNTLLGGLPRLDSWATQFYEARSQIVHEGKSKRLAFNPTDNAQNNNGDNIFYRPLVTTGRQIFQACVATIITGSKLSENMGLSSHFVTNKQRLENICKTVRKFNGNHSELFLEIRKDVIEFSKYRFIPENDLNIDLLLTTTLLILEKFKLHIVEDDHYLTDELQKISKINSKNHYEALEIISSLVKKVKELPHNGEITNEFWVVKSLIESVWGYSYIYFFQLKKEKTVS